MSGTAPIRREGNHRVRPVLPSEPPSSESVASLTTKVARYALSGVTVGLVAYLAKKTPQERFLTATKVVLYRLMTTSGEAPDPCLAAEEQVMLEEVNVMISYQDARVAAGLLCLQERYALARAFRRAFTDLPGDPPDAQ